MTPQQKKADELVGRFLEYANPYEKDKSWFGLLKYTTDEMILNAIQCAIICVEEMIAELKSHVDNYDLDFHFKEVSPTQTTIPYWQSVLNELKSRL